MSIPKKGSRTIRVRGKQYRWLRKGRTRYYGDTPQHLHLAIQIDEGFRGRVLLADLHTNSPCVEDGMHMHVATLYPKDVEAIILAALDNGWEPSERGIAFTLREPLALSEYSVWTHP